MSDMPPEFYVPAFTALIGALSILAGTVKVLYAANQVLQAKIEQLAIEEAKGITLNTEALRGSTDAMLKLAELYTEAVHGQAR